jgi:cyclase
MPLAHRIIPTFLVKGQMLVKGRRFSGDRVIGHARQAIRVQASRGVDELALLDITATREGRGPDLKLVEELTEGLFAPLSVGGGVRSIRHIKDLLAAGADKVVIGSWAPALVKPAADHFGSQAIVAAIDVVGGRVAWECGHAVAASLHPVGYARQLADEGAGEILLTSIDREGTMNGYDLDLIHAVSAAVSVPVIAHGGCRDYADMAAALESGAAAVAAGALFQYEDATPRAAAAFLAEHGIEVRL